MRTKDVRRMLIRTYSGSSYIIDYDAKTWERCGAEGETKIGMPPNKGTFEETSDVQRGQPLLICYEDRGDSQIIRTTNVKSVRALRTKNPRKK